MALLIPRIFHQVWVGPDPVPEQFARYQETWLHHHPGWELRFWTEEHLPEGLRRTEAYERLRSPVERCDILRLEVVWRDGGVYLDTDFECLRSIEPLLDGVAFFTADIEPGRVNHAILGAVPGHPILDVALDELRPREFHGYDKAVSGPLFFDRIVARHPEATRFEKALFYGKSRQGAYAVHHDANMWKDADLLTRDIEKARLHERKARAEAARWRSKYVQSEATLLRLRVGRRLLAASARLGRRWASALAKLGREKTVGAAIPWAFTAVLDVGSTAWPF